MRHLRRAAIIMLAVLTGLALLFVSVGPSVEPRTRPTARDIQAAREAWRQLKAASHTGVPQRIRLDNRMIGALAVLASDAAGAGSFDARIDDGALVAQASVPLAAGLWVNASATVAGQHEGFPAYRLKVGRVAFPLRAGRWLADGARWMLRRNGARIPPLDDIVRQVSVEREHLWAELALPTGSGVVRGAMAASGLGLDEPLVREIYCRIAGAGSAGNLSQVVRTAFEDPSPPDAAEYSRAAFVALAFRVVGGKAHALAPRAAELAKRCTRPGPAVLLHAREDLAKHWALSAALAAVFGQSTAASLGEWKELDDSLPEGSGFSFVDVAADRAGLQTALRATDPSTAAETFGVLGRATEDELMPRALLQAPEGLGERSFRDRFGSLDQQAYRRAVAAIDRTLAEGRTR